MLTRKQRNSIVMREMLKVYFHGIENSYRRNNEKIEYQVKKHMKRVLMYADNACNGIPINIYDEIDVQNILIKQMSVVHAGHTTVSVVAQMQVLIEDLLATKQFSFLSIDSWNDCLEALTDLHYAMSGNKDEFDAMDIGIQAAARLAESM